MCVHEQSTEAIKRKKQQHNIKPYSISMRIGEKTTTQYQAIQHLYEKCASERMYLFIYLVGVLVQTQKYFNCTKAASQMVGGNRAVPRGNL